jgi:hypothetical protein
MLPLRKRVVEVRGIFCHGQFLVISPFLCYILLMSITQTVTIPADHHLRLDFEVPPQIPAGATARLELFWSPQKEAVNNLDTALEKIWALCKDSPVTVDSFLEMRRHDKELEENQYRQFFEKSGNNN